MGRIWAAYGPQASSSSFPAPAVMVAHFVYITPKTNIIVNFGSDLSFDLALDQWINIWLIYFNNAFHHYRLDAEFSSVIIKDSPLKMSSLNIS